jgi:hypothetical protein
MERNGEILTEKNSDSSTRALWQSYQQNHLVAKQKEMGEGKMNLDLQSIFIHTWKVCLTYRKI